MPSSTLRYFVVFLAIALPWQVAFYAVPIVSFADEALAFFGWGALLLALGPQRRGFRPPAPVIAFLAAIALLAGTAVLQLLIGKTVWPSQTAQVVYFLAAAALVFWTGAQMKDAPARLALMDQWAWCWVLAGGLGALTGFAQYLQLPLSIQLVAALADVGRVYGNVHQANHFSTLMVLALPCIAWLLYRKKLSIAWAVLFVWIATATVVLTSSRTGIVQLTCIAVWMLLLPQIRKALPLSLVLAALVAFGAFYFLNYASVLSFHNAARLPSMVASPALESRLELWRDAFAMALQNPWLGVGVGQFEFFHVFSDLPTNLTIIHINAHLLPLQIAVEYGLLVALLFMALVVYAVYKAGRAWRDPVAHFSAGWVVLVLIHSLTEFPLWYAFFLLPFAFQCGLYFSATQETGNPRETPGAALARRLHTYGALAVLAGIALATTHYLPTIAMYVLNSKDITRNDRLATAQKAFLYKHWIVYNSIGGTSFSEITQHPELIDLFDKSSRFYMNEFNVAQYALVLAENGRLEQANRVVHALRARSADKLAALRSYCQTAASPGAAALFQLIDAPKRPTVSAKDF